MVQVTAAEMKDLNGIARIDAGVIENEARKEMLGCAIRERACLVAKVDDEIAGFLTYHRHFFGQWFIDLVIVSPSKRRIGVATALIHHMESALCPGEKLFTSTNESNAPMQKAFERLGFLRSGLIDNLDDGDPEVIYFKRVGSPAE